MRYILAILAIATSLGAPSVGSGAIEFMTPSQAAYCGRSDTRPVRLVCVTPADGYTVSMERHGRVRARFVPGNAGRFPPKPPALLRPGERWKAGGYVCSSAFGGLTCTNRSGHGWLLGRIVEHRLF